MKTYLIIINIVTLLAFIVDKYNAIKKRYRISEKLLFFLAIIGGSLGALIGIHVFRHKSKKLKFLIGIPLILIIQIIVLWRILWELQLEKIVIE